MLRRAGERRELVAAERDEDAARRSSPMAPTAAPASLDLDPAIAGDGDPRRPAQRHERHAGFARGGGGVLPK